jgi:hypothetical protein
MPPKGPQTTVEQITKGWSRPWFVVLLAAYIHIPLKPSNGLDFEVSTMSPEAIMSLSRRVTHSVAVTASGTVLYR